MFGWGLGFGVWGFFMIDHLDQIFVLLKHWALGWPFWPDSLKPMLSVLFSIVPLMLVFALLFGITTVVERKAIGRIQNRYGPNRVGLPFTDVRLFEEIFRSWLQI